MSKKATNKIISIFGEIEEMVAKQMMAEGKGVGKLAPTLSISLDDQRAPATINSARKPAWRSRCRAT